MVRLHPSLAPEWRFPLDTPFDAIDDCYALNVSGEVAWSCYYSRFTIVRAQGRPLEGWRNDVRGAAALIIAGRGSTLHASFDDHWCQLSLADLGVAEGASSSLRCRRAHGG